MKLAKLLLAVVAIAGTIAGANAKTWRVNPNPNSGAEYNSIADLENSYKLMAGDTILCEPGEYVSATVNQPNIVIMGPGYFLGQNEKDAQVRSAVFSTLKIKEYTEVVGIYLSGTLWISSNCTIQRCHIPTIDVVQFGVAKNCTITNSYIGSVNWIKTSKIYNNIILSSIRNVDDSEIFNNTFAYSYNGYIFESNKNCNFYNNICINMRQGADTQNVPYSTYIMDFDQALANNNNIYNNVFSIPERWANKTFTSGNKYCGATVENTFINEGSDDGKYRLKDGSPAKGAATHGGDCGAFGGASPYVLSGIPRRMPRISEASVPDSPTDGKLSVKLTIATQNE